MISIENKKFHLMAAVTAVMLSAGFPFIPFTIQNPENGQFDDSTQSLVTFFPKVFATFVRYNTGDKFLGNVVGTSFMILELYLMASLNVAVCQLIKDSIVEDSVTQKDIL